jgi:hypothetical protein
MFPGAVGAAENAAVAFHSVADDLAVTTWTDWGKSLDRTLERIKCVPVSSEDHFERVSVAIAAAVAGFHNKVSLCFGQSRISAAG